MASLAGNVEFDVNTIDLSILEDIKLADNFVKVVLKDIGEITLTTNENGLESVVINSNVVSAEINAISEYDFELKEIEDNYVDIALLLPFAENAVEFISNNTFSGNINVKYEDIEIVGDYVVYIENGLYAEANIEAFGQNINVIYSEEYLYISLLDSSFKVNLNNLESILEEIAVKFGLEINLDLSNSSDILTEAFDKEINPLFIKNLIADENSLTITLFNDMSFTISSLPHEFSVETNLFGAEISANIIGSDSEKVTNFKPSYVDIEDLLPIVENVYDYAFGKEYYVEFSGNYQDYSAQGAVNFTQNGLEFAVLVEAEEISANVIMKNNIIYISAENLNLMFALRDIERAKTFVKDAFAVDIDQIFDDIYTEYGVDINNLINFVQGNEELILPKFESKEISLSDIEKILTEISLNVTLEEINVTYNDVSAKITISENMIDTIEIVYNDISANVSILNSPSIFSAEGNYLDIIDLLSYGEKILDYINSKQIDISAIVTKVESGAIYNGHLQVDFTSLIKMSAVISSPTEKNMDMTANVEDGMFYFNYNGLCLKIDENNLNELIYIACEMFGIDYKLVPFIGEIDLDLDLSQIEMKNSLSIDLATIAQILKMIKGFEKQGENLVITLDNSIIYGSSDAQDMIITLTVQDEQIKSLRIENVYTSSDLKSSILIELVLNEWTEFNGVDKSKNYVDISGSNELIKAIINMTSSKYFHITGKIDIAGQVIGMDITNLAQTLLNDIIFDIYIKVLDDGKVELFGSLGEIPAVVGLDNDVPYKFGDTESGSGRTLNFYYKDNFVYLYRSEKVDQLFGMSSRTYEKEVKVSLNTFLNDPMFYILQYGVGLKENIMELINEAVAKTKNRTTPIDYSNIIKSFIVNNENSYTINLNMAEIANNTDLDTLSLTLNLAKDKDDKNYVALVKFSIYMPIADEFKLTLSSNNITVKDYGSEFSMDKLYNFINGYKYNEGEFWQASNGSWELASETKYSVTFVNGQNTISTVTGKPGANLSFPSMSTYVVDDGIAQKTYVFDGWFTNSNLKESSRYSKTTFPSGDTTLYAKFIETCVYYRTISFVSNSADSIANITTLAGSSITIPSLDQKVETEGTTTTYYDFAGWFISPSFEEDSKFEEAYMPDNDVILYAKWLFNRTELGTHTLNVYDNNVLILSLKVQEGKTIDLSQINVNSDTLFYLDSNYSTAYSGEFVMGEDDLSLHIRNKYNIVISSAYGNVINEVYSLYQGESIIIPSQESYVVDDGVTQTTYTFLGYNETFSIVPNEDKTVEANWQVTVKHYYTITFKVEWYKPSWWITSGNNQKITNNTAPSSLKVLEGTNVNLSQYGADISVKYGITYNYSVKAWSESSGGKGTALTSISNISRNYTLYAVWNN